MICPLQPILFQVHSQIASDYHPPAVGHKPSRIHVPYKRVNEGHARAALPPSLNSFLIIFPVIVRAIVYAVGVEDFVSIAQTPVAIEVSPEKLIHVNLSGLILSSLFLKLFDLEVDITRGN